MSDMKVTICDWCLRGAPVQTIEDKLWCFWSIISNEDPLKTTLRKICMECKSRYEGFSTFIETCKSNETIVAKILASVKVKEEPPIDIEYYPLIKEEISNEEGHFIVKEGKERRKERDRKYRERHREEINQRRRERRQVQRGTRQIQKYVEIYDSDLFLIEVMPDAETVNLFKERKRKELQKERQRRYRERHREEINQRKKEYRQRLLNVQQGVTT